MPRVAIHSTRHPGPAAQPRDPGSIGRCNPGDAIDRHPCRMDPGSGAGVTNENVAMLRVGDFDGKGVFMGPLV